jgi:hypothetical protein
MTSWIDTPPFASEPPMVDAHHNHADGLVHKHPVDVTVGWHEHPADEPLTEAEGGNELVIGPDEVGPRFGPLLPAIVHPGPRDALVLVDPGTGEELHLSAESTRQLLNAVRSTGTLFPATREVPGFIDRALHG